jgi:hypothetical protein
MNDPSQQSYKTRFARWRAGRRFARLWRMQLRLEKKLRHAVGPSEEEAIRDQIREVDRQRELLAQELGGGYPVAYEQGLIGPI